MCVYKGILVAFNVLSYLLPIEVLTSRGQAVNFWRSSFKPQHVKPGPSGRNRTVLLGENCENGDLPGENCVLGGENGDLPGENGDLPGENG